MVIKSISDDVGNTAPTATQEFTLEPTVEIETEKVFRVDYTTGSAIGIDGEGTFAVEGYRNTDNDIVKITFTQPVSVVGTGSATDVKNYALNGRDLPTGAQIIISDDDGYEITIYLPTGTFEANAETGVIVLASQLVSDEGIKITGDLAFTFIINE